MRMSSGLRLARTIIPAITPSSTTPNLVFLHGVLGSAGTYTSLLRRHDCAPCATKLAPDLPGHGRSPHDSTRLTYSAMAVDVATVIAEERQKHQPEYVDMCGHSMGGKVAMTIALQNPSAIRKLIVVDVAPLAYAPPTHARDISGGPELDTFVPYVAARAMQAVQRDGLVSGVFPRREDVDAALEKYGVTDSRVRMFVCTNLVLGSQKGNWSWRCDVDGIVSAFERDDDTGFFGFDPRCSHTTQSLPNKQHYKHLPENVFDRPALFVVGGRSRYVKKKHQIDAVYQRFPHAKIVTMQNCGHWLQAEDPDGFLQILNQFLDA